MTLIWFLSALVGGGGLYWLVVGLDKDVGGREGAGSTDVVVPLCSTRPLSASADE